MKTTKENLQIVNRAMQRWDECWSVWREIHATAREDDRFVAGDQWPADMKRKREAKGRPCHVINKVKTTVRRVINENRRNRPQIRVIPVDNTTDVETCDVVNGLLKTIAYCSDAEIAYDTAMEHAASHGFGWLRVVTDYVDNMSFDQEIKIERVADPYSVLIPIHLCAKYGMEDAPYVFVVKTIGKDEFDRKYPGRYDAGWDTKEARVGGWIDDKTIRVAEYFEAEETEKTLYLLNNGIKTRVKPSDESMIVNQRRVTDRRWVRYLLTCADVLEKNVWPGSRHPFVPILGEEMLVDDKIVLMSIVRPAIDPQRMFNYWRSCETEMIALAPKAPFIGARGQFEGYERLWRTANTENHSYLEYNPVVDATGQTVLPPPRRNDNPQIPTAYVNAAREAADDIKSVTGVFDASLGNIGNETSGIAIRSRQAQSDIVNYHYADNMARSLRQLGKIIVDLIPVIYDTERIIRIIGDDKNVELVYINKETKGGEPAIAGEPKKYVDLRYGKYDVMVDVGPAYQSKREEAVANMIELLRTFPQLTPLVGDLVVENMDIAGAKKIADRIRKALPPQVIESESKDGKEEALPSKQEILQILSDLQKTQQALAEATALLDDKQADRSLKMDLAILQSETAITLERIRNGANINLEAFRAEREKILSQSAAPTAEPASSNGQPSAALEQPQTQAVGGQLQQPEVSNGGE